MLLKTEQELDMQKAYLLEANRRLVDNIIIMINHALSNQIDWKELALIVEDAKQRDDPLACHIVELKLQTSQAVIRLKDPFESSSDVNETLMKSGKKHEYTEVVVDIDVNALTNAQKYYDKKRAASKKEEKTISVSRKVLKSAVHNAEMKMKTAKTVAQITEVRKPMWFEKFFWFISSENYLVVAGHDSQQNEVLVKRYLKPGDIFVHADIHGASTVIIKARHLTSEEVDSSKHQDLLHQHSLPLPPPKTLLEAGNMAVVLSSAWQSHVLTRAWWVHHDQVSKTAPSGEYLTSGAFMIRGKKNYLPPCPFDYGFGIMFKLHEDSIAKHEGERRIIIIDTPSYEMPLNQFESLTIQNDEETTAFPDAFLQLDLANDLPRHKDPDVSEILSENPFKKVRTRGQKVEKSKPTKKTTNLNKETIEVNKRLNESLLPSTGQPVLKRGQKAKLKKIKQKYNEQDDEERNLRMKILQGDDAKPSQYHQILERDHLSNLIKIPQSVRDTQVVHNSDSIQNNQPDCDNNESFSNSSSEIDNHPVKSDESEEDLKSLEAMECPSGVPQCSVLGPLLFLIYINDLPQQVTSELLLFADDVKLWREIRNQDEIQAFQEDPTRLQSQADNNGLAFNTSKCKVVHLRDVADYSYNLGNSSLVVFQVEKDLGVLVPHDLKSYATCDENAFRANLALVMLKRIFGQFDGRTFHIIFNSFIRPHLEYGNIVLPP
ncbi:unnamed protein product [Schistosoma curassoni]|uniref:NFACT-R_1 domain-containing protein n=1 Tax=Schistosoma curassoni TaxID=6186 RepID=A0A183KFR8_9TREM|nr:unnamed protein product [Schistosoma curassoni]